ncbi:MAG TPA: SpoIVB peptidase S55 domain-containing protein [Polyangiaceae bacterium]|nr:SpoIVB peptidase S55 domain-containing protein [Polyangiaceae bacterium]
MIRLSPSRTLIAATIAGLLASLPLVKVSADGRTNRPNVMSVSEIKPGMKGYGLTVFEGTKPERFDVEVIGVLPNFAPRQELILIKTKHPRLDVTKVVAGMSGSPIYINDKMIGAYAYGWSFGDEPVAGVTPIRAMLDDIERPLPKELDGWPVLFDPKSPRVASNKGEGGAGNRYQGSLKDYSLEHHAQQIAQQRNTGVSPQSPLQPVATPLLFGGMTPGAIALANELLEPLGLTSLQAGGGGTQKADAPKRFEDGGALGVQLIRGDMNAMGLGTVTRVEGDKLLGFGHPMMNSGVTNLPTAVGEVLWFLASSQRSFKIGMGVRDVGALVSDRQASIVVSHSAVPHVIPVSLKIKGAAGAPYTDWNFEVTHDKFMAPTFVAIALGSALQAAASEHQDVSYTATSKLKVRGFGELSIDDYGVAVGGTPEPRDFLRSNLVYAVGVLLNNPWRPVAIESANMEIDLHYSRDLLRLRGAEVMEREVLAGEDAHVRLTLLPFAGPAITRVVTVHVPKYLAGEKLTIEIQPGYMVQRAHASPDSLAQTVENLQNPTYPPKSVVLSYVSGDGLAFKGRIAEDLPPGVMETMRPTTSTVAPEPYRSQTDQVVPLDDFVVGGDSVTVQVKSALH